MKYALIVNGEWYSTHKTYEDAYNKMCEFASCEDSDFIRYYGSFPTLEIMEIKQ